MILKFKMKLWSKQQSQNEGLWFNHESVNAENSNVMTRSLKSVLLNDLSSLTLHSHLKSELLASANIKHQFIDSQSEVTAVDHESSFMKVDELIMKDVEVTIKKKLKQEIECCQNYYHRKTFIVNSDECSETVNSDEINYFFSCFQERKWLTNFNLMPLLFSFNWLSMTLILHSFYASFTTFNNSNQQSDLRIQWLLHDHHDCIIISCCFQSHWTLFDVNLKCNFIQQYDFMTEHVLKSAEVISVIKVWLTHAMKE